VIYTSRWATEGYSIKFAEMKYIHKFKLKTVCYSFIAKRTKNIQERDLGATYSAHLNLINNEARDYKHAMILQEGM